MRTRTLILGLATVFSIASARAATLYVNAASTNPVPPYADWPTAAAVIQDAVDAALAGDEIVVTNGVYQTGARAVYGMSNRVAVTKPLTVRSVNGPTNTIIQGAGPIGENAIRCVYLTNGAVLAGFTVTNGATQFGFDPEISSIDNSGGGVWCESQTAVLTNCVFAGNSAFHGGAADSGTLNNCFIIGNSVGENGGGAAMSTLNNCTLMENFAEYGGGGGAYASILNNCTLVGNSADPGTGGGAEASTLKNCALTNNTANGGGGAHGSTLNNCTLTYNSATSAWSDYSRGGGAAASTLTNCTLSGNGAAGRGGGAYLSTLADCIITGNAAGAGGGASESTLTKCIVSGNSAHEFSGGGTWSSALNNCTLTGNQAYNGGGAYYGTLTNCVVTGNSAWDGSGGGAVFCIFFNCIVYDNTARVGGPNYAGGTFNYSCTTPMPASGVGNITNAPLFVDTNGWSNLRLQSNSPCINAGNNVSVTSVTDLDGLPRIAGARVDIGAYEFQGAGLSGFSAWLWQHGQATDGSADFTDPDADGANNFQEFRCRTDPTNPLSVLRLRSPAPSGSDVAVTWQSATGVNYALEWSTNLGAVPAFQPLATNLPGQAGLTTFIHTNGAAASPRFYRVRVP